MINKFIKYNLKGMCKTYKQARNQLNQSSAPREGA